MHFSYEADEADEPETVSASAAPTSPVIAPGQGLRQFHNKLPQIIQSHAEEIAWHEM